MEISPRPYWRYPPNSPARYAVALLATTVVVLAGWGLKPLLGDSLPSVTIFPLVAFTAWYWGLGPSIMTVVLIFLSTKYWFIEPTHSLRIASASQLIGLAAMVFASGVVIAIGEVSRRVNERLLKAQGELEERVQQRTAELNRANESLSELTARLLQSQDDERRRIARDLHDSVGQTLAALGMNLSSVEADIERLMKVASVIKDSRELVRETSTNIRTISYLLHPPLLDERGLSSALPWYVDGFAERSKIEVDLELPHDFGRLSRDSEIAIFRVVQECLTNIHRHSGSASARIVISCSETDVWVEVRDQGNGIPPEKRSELASAGTPGVGIRGMRERVRQLGGNLEISSGGIGTGTIVVARLPLAPSAGSVAVANQLEGPPTEDEKFSVGHLIAAEEELKKEYTWDGLS